MNIFQVLNQRRPSKIVSSKDKLSLIGAKYLQSPEMEDMKSSVKYAKSIQFGLRINTYSMNSVSENSVIEAFRHVICLKHQRKHEKYIISQDNKAKKIFNFWMCLMCYYSVISSLYYLAFQQKDETINGYDIAVWICFLIDLTLNFITEFTNKKGVRIANLKLIAKNYAKFWLVLDIIALLPLAYTGNPNTEYFLRLVRIGKLKRILNLVEKDLIIEKISEMVYKSSGKKKKRLRVFITYAWEIFKKLLRMLFFTYIVACLWYYFVDFIRRKYNPDKNFIDYFNLDEEEVNKKFIKTWYYIFTTLATVGFGDFYAVNKYEMALSFVILILGSTYFAFVMGDIVAVCNLLGDLDGDAKKRITLEMWISFIEREYRVIPISLKEKIVLHYSNFWKNDRLASILNSSQEMHFRLYEISDPFYADLPSRLKKNIIDYIFSDIFYKFKFFFRVFYSIRLEIARFLQPRIFPKNTVILEYGSYAKEVIFANSGDVIMGIKNEDGKYTELLKISSGFTIGDDFLLRNIEAFVEFRAKSNVKAFALPGFVLQEVQKEFKIQVDDYLTEKNSVYSAIFQNANINLDFHRTETNEKEINKEKESLLNKSLYLDIKNADLINETREEKLALSNELTRINFMISGSNTKRKNIISDLKEKLLGTLELIKSLKLDNQTNL
ncbi:hypothetical protein SteCoe_14118 [Stentor coeruleus]|uniref:Cyclic nucleotide-binding domain-containing protein n=1 Tax=Stentor coeruleus TaxID=5963 RepID=A0A1R2C6T7_9CILI|nr:hypothetical protein SteCoe_14118 [Stentor coeruleus]